VANVGRLQRQATTEIYGHAGPLRSVPPNKTVVDVINVLHMSTAGNMNIKSKRKYIRINCC